MCCSCFCCVEERPKKASFLQFQRCVPLSLSPKTLSSETICFVWCSFFFFFFFFFFLLLFFSSLPFPCLVLSLFLFLFNKFSNDSSLSVFLNRSCLLLLIISVLFIYFKVHFSNCPCLKLIVLSFCYIFLFFVLRCFLFLLICDIVVTEKLQKANFDKKGHF